MKYCLQVSNFERGNSAKLYGMKSLFLTLTEARHMKIQFVARANMLDVLLCCYLAYGLCVVRFKIRQNILTSTYHVTVLYVFYLNVRKMHNANPV